MMSVRVLVLVMELMLLVLVLLLVGYPPLSPQSKVTCQKEVVLCRQRRRLARVSHHRPATEVLDWSDLDLLRSAVVCLSVQVP